MAESVPEVTLAKTRPGASDPGAAADISGQRAVRNAPAKVNLSLHVTGRRADGYHELDGLIAFADIGDRLTVEAAPTTTLALSGSFAEALRAEPDNLVLAAATRLARAGKIVGGAAMTLEKELPVAAGIGGGSADAAAALQALQVVWGLDLDAAALGEIALDLGADVPVCLHGRAAFIGGIGERIVPAPPLPPAWLVLVNPGVALSTAAVFRARPRDTRTPRPPWTRAPASADELATWLARDDNDLEATARRLVPDIDRVLSALRDTEGCRLQRMSGSGATCFGLYADPDAAARAAESLAAAAPAWWVRAGRLLP